MNHPDDDGHTKTIFCLGGCPGAGKSTIRRELLAWYPDDVVFLRRWTTRPIRPGDGDEYVHLSEEQFVQAAANAGRLLALSYPTAPRYAVCQDELAAYLRGPRQWIGCLAGATGLALLGVGHEVVGVYLTVSNRSVLAQRLRTRGYSEVDVSRSLREYDDDSQWAEAITDGCSAHILSTDHLTIPETVAAVARILRLPVPTIAVV